MLCLESENFELTPYEQLALRSSELAINAWLMGAAASGWPLVVQEQWDERIEGLIGKLEQEIREIQAFAEAFDED